MKNRKAISPVIATIIIVAVAITIAIAAAFWVTGIAGLFTRFEKLEVAYIYAAPLTTGGWTITLNVRNTGTTPATIDLILLNSKIYGEVTINPPTPIKVDIGKPETIELTIPETLFGAGTAVEVKLHTAAGNEYFKAVILP